MSAAKEPVQFQAYIAPARVQPQPWRLIVGMILVFLVYVGLLAAAGGLVYLRYGPLIAYGILTSLVNGATAGGVLMLLFSFAALLLGTIAATRLLHGRPATTLVGDGGRAVHDFFRVAGVILVVQGLAALASVLVAGEAPVRSAATLAVFYPFALVGLLIQVGAEEALFRGYVMQQLAARYRSRLVWMGLPSAMFGLAHYAPEQFGAATWFVVAWAALFGVLAADLTRRTGTLGAAIGFHFATNAVALLLVGVKGNLDGLALWTVDIDTSTLSAALPVAVTDFLSIIVGWLAARLVLRV